MNPLTNVKNITKLNEIELSKGITKSWHDIYKGSAWIFIGGLAYGLTEGDILTVFSQYGEIVNINLVRDKKTGKTKGYCFLCYANQKSTILAVDNFNGMKLCSRTIRVDHVANYKPPKEDERDDEITKILKSDGCLSKPVISSEGDKTSHSKLEKKKKKIKKEKKHKKKKKKANSSESDTGNKVPFQKKIQIKEEKHDPEYDKYDTYKNSFSLDKRYQEHEKFGEGFSGHRFQSKMKDQDRTERTRDSMHHNSKSVHKRKFDSVFGKSKESHKVSVNKDEMTREKYLKRTRSSSEDSFNSANSESGKSRRENSESKYLKKNQHRKSKHDSTSSSDDHSTSYSSSDNEQKCRNKSTEKHECRVYDDVRTQHKDNYSDVYKNRHYDRNSERYEEYKSKRRY